MALTSVSGVLILMMALQLSNLLALLDNRVRLVAITHCSNLVGEINPVRQIADVTHDAGGFYWLTASIALTVSLI